MLLKAPIATITNWKIQFSSTMITQSSLTSQQPKIVNPIINSSQLPNHPKFQRFYSKSNSTNESSSPPNEDEIIQQVKNLLDGKNGSPKDPQKAAKLLKQLTDTGSARAMVMYGGMLENGVGFNRQEIDLAGQYYKEASEKGKSSEFTLIYLQYLKRYNKEDAFSSYVKKIEGEDDGNGSFVLGLMSLHEGKQSECDKYLKMSISKDNVDAMILQSSLLIKKNPTESMSLLKRAIEKGSLIAMYGYASFIAKGEFGPIKNGKDKEAFLFMKKAADGGIRDAIVEIADWYLTGFGCVRNVENSLLYYKKAADSLNDPFSQFSFGSLSLCIENSDKKVAVDYLKKSDHNNFPDASFKLGFCFLNGKGVQKNITEANKYFKRAADSENADCDMILNYAVRLLVGENIKKDPKEAERFLKKGADLGNKMCTQLLKNLKKID